MDTSACRSWSFLSKYKGIITVWLALPRIDPHPISFSDPLTRFLTQEIELTPWSSSSNSLSVDHSCCHPAPACNGCRNNAEALQSMHSIFTLQMLGFSSPSHLRWHWAVLDGATKACWGGNKKQSVSSVTSWMCLSLFIFISNFSENCYWYNFFESILSWYVEQAHTRQGGAVLWEVKSDPRCSHNRDRQVYPCHLSFNLHHLLWQSVRPYLSETYKKIHVFSVNCSWAWMFLFRCPNVN